MSARIATTSLSPALGEICAVQRPAGVTGAMVTVVVLTVGVVTVGAVVGAVEAAADVVVDVVDVDVVVGVPENRGWRNSIQESRYSTESPSETRKNVGEIA